MALEFKTKELFQAEIEEYMNINGSTLLEAILEYQKKYDLDENYLVKNFISGGVYEKLLIEAHKYNLIKHDKKRKSLNGI